MNVIVCAAIRNRRGEIICGVRHYDAIMRGQTKNLGKWNPHTPVGDPSRVEQGFVDRMGKFHSRLDAWAIAYEAGQIVKNTPNKGILYSEDLY